MKAKNIQRIAGVVVSATALFGTCAVAPASAINNIKGFGVQETLKDFYNLGDFSSEIGYTVKDLKPSRDVVPYPVAGRLYEANATTTAVVGTVTPQIVNFIARSPGGTDYRVLPTVSTLSGAPPEPGSQRIREAVLRRGGRKPRQRRLQRRLPGPAWLGGPAARRAGRGRTRNRQQRWHVVRRDLRR